MPRLKVLHNTREIGFLELPDWALETNAVQLPVFEGSDTGLAIVIELRDEPVAGVVYRWGREFIDVTTPTRLQFPRAEGRLSPDHSIFRHSAVLDLSESPPEGGDVRFSWRTRNHEEKEFREREFQGWGWFALEVHEEGFFDASFRGEPLGPPPRPPFLSEGYFRGSFSGGPRGDGGEFYFDILAGSRFRFGRGEGHFRGSDFSKGDPSAGEFSLNVFSRGPFGVRMLFRGGTQGKKTESSEAVSSLSWLIGTILEQFQRIAPEQAVIPFTLWIGKVNYDAAAAGLPTDARVRQSLANSLMENRPLSAKEALSVAQWVQRSLGSPDVGVGRDVQRAVMLELVRPYVTLTRQDVSRVQFAFDDSVASDNALLFLTTLARRIREQGGRLCLDVE